jgi:hypothetical protein
VVIGGGLFFCAGVPFLVRLKSRIIFHFTDQIPVLTTVLQMPTVIFLFFPVLLHTAEGFLLKQQRRRKNIVKETTITRPGRKSPVVKVVIELKNLHLHASGADIDHL